MGSGRTSGMDLSAVRDLEVRKMKQKASKWMNLAALLLFVVATFQIVSDHFLLGAVYFGAAVCFMTAAAGFKKKETKAEQKDPEENSIQNHADL